MNPARPHPLLLLHILIFVAGIIFIVFRMEVIYDDPYITFRYAKNLADGKGFVFNEGERVGGTTTPLSAFVMAGLFKIGIPLRGIVGILGAIAYGLMGAASWLLFTSHGSRIGALAFGLLLLSDPGISCAVWPGNRIVRGTGACRIRSV